MKIDLHTHSIASGHGSSDTITDLAREAARRKLTHLGISDHAPAMVGAASVSYFRNLPDAPRSRFGVRLLFGAELNILNDRGDVDLDDALLRRLDYAIISLHSPLYKSGDPKANTNAYINAMKHPGVRIIGHPDDIHFPVLPEELVLAARNFRVLPEINNTSLSPDSYRRGAAPVDRMLLQYCREYQVPVLIGSDSHGMGRLGDDQYARSLMNETGFPQSLIANDHPKLLSSYLPLPL